MYNYKLIERKQEDGIEVIIKGDVNDADYVKTAETYSIENLDNKEFMLCIKMLHDLYYKTGFPYKSNNWRKRQEILKQMNYSEDDLLWLGEWDNISEYISIPFGEYCDCHTIVDLTIDIYKDGKKYSIDFI